MTAALDVPEVALVRRALRLIEAPATAVASLARAHLPPWDENSGDELCSLHKALLDACDRLMVEHHEIEDGLRGGRP